MQKQALKEHEPAQSLEWGPRDHCQSLPCHSLSLLLPSALVENWRRYHESAGCELAGEQQAEEKLVLLELV